MKRFSLFLAVSFPMFCFLLLGCDKPNESFISLRIENNTPYQINTMRINTTHIAEQHSENHVFSNIEPNATSKQFDFSFFNRLCYAVQISAQANESLLANIEQNPIDCLFDDLLDGGKYVLKINQINLSNSSLDVQLVTE